MERKLKYLYIVLEKIHVVSRKRGYYVNLHKKFGKPTFEKTQFLENMVSKKVSQVASEFHSLMKHLLRYTIKHKVTYQRSILTARNGG